MVNIKRVGNYWAAALECSRCSTSRITQHHLSNKPVTAVTSIVKTTARTLGWKVSQDKALCGQCRKRP